MTLLLIASALPALYLGYFCWERHRRALPGPFYLLLSANGALQGMIGGFGLGVAVLFGIDRLTGGALGLDEPGAMNLRRGATAFLASGLPVVAIHLVYLLPAWAQRNRDAVLALSSGLVVWAIASLIVGLLIVLAEFYPGA